MNKLMECKNCGFSTFDAQRYLDHFDKPVHKEYAVKNLFPESHPVNNEEGKGGLSDEFVKKIIDVFYREHIPSEIRTIEIKQQLESILSALPLQKTDEKELKESKAPESDKGEVDYKAKYEKCISVINKFDPGIIGMYDL